MQLNQTLPQDQTCQVYQGDTPIFTSQSHWLHPLFELHDFFEESPLFSDRENRKSLLLKDRIIGRGAALMIVNLGIKQCETPILSQRALPIFEQYKVICTYTELVERLPCQTEDILADERDPQKAWDILFERATRAKEALRNRT